MRRLLAFGASSVLVVTACVDLFHDTDFAFEKLVDASTLEDVTSPDAPITTVPDSGEFCDLDVEAAVRVAHRACALLAACAQPVGNNATGRCLERALPIIACKGAPGQRVHGDTLTYWKCLAAATTCEDVNVCVLGAKPTPCNAPEGAFTDCLADGRVRVSCAADLAPPAIESCVANGQRCSTEAGTTACTGTGGLRECGVSGCEGTMLRRCTYVIDGGKPDSGRRDDGFDCMTFGAQRCVETTKGAACAPVGTTCDTPETKCTTDMTASGCIGGRSEVLDCTIFGGKCHKELADAAALDLVRMCTVPSQDGSAPCVRDECSGTSLTACALGNRIDIACRDLVGTDCAIIGDAGAACGVPTN